MRAQCKATGDGILCIGPILAGCGAQLEAAGQTKRYCNVVQCRLSIGS
jgi:hypothetical protein